MSRFLFALRRICVLSVLSARARSMESAGLPDITDGAFVADCVSVHNKYRSSVTPTAADMRYMSWDEDLAKMARAWARHCKFTHNPLLKTPGKSHPDFPTVGENIWVGGSFTIFTVQSAIKMWYDEVQHYTFSTTECSSVCGHYTQVVWASSYKVGCAVQVCPRGVEGFSDKPTATLFVCNYGEGGNYEGHPPYKEGVPCSKCRNATCQDNLCRDSEDSSSTCDSGCLGVLVTRPILVLLTFSAVYGLQLLYPNLFAYE